jgi:hypothetical protein
MFGPSPLLAASSPHANRFVAGWNVNTGQFMDRAVRYAIGPKIENVTANVLNVVDDTHDDVIGVALAFVVGALMIQSPACY